MSSSDDSFDLVSEPWVGVRDLSGRPDELGLRDTLRSAHDLAGISGEIPTQTFALTRLLLAVLHRALDGPRDLEAWTRLWTSEELPAEQIDAYLDRWRHRFDLLDPEVPFFQVADLRTAKGEFSELEKLVADVPNGKPFFTTRAGAAIDLSYPEAARWVVHAQAFDPSGIKSGCVGDDRAKHGKGYPIGVAWSGHLGGVLLEGATLRETLLLNLVATSHEPFRRAAGSDDRPAWERDPDGPAARTDAAGSEAGPRGPLELYTWQSRRIRLGAAAHGRIRRVLIGNGDRLLPQNRHVVEPHSGWRRSAAQEKKPGAAPVVYMPLTHDPERTVWRGLESMLPRPAGSQRGEAAPRLAPAILEWLSALVADGILPLDHQVRMRTVAMIYGSQSSVTSEVVDDALALRAVLVGQDPELIATAIDAVGAADGAARTLGDLATNLAVAAGGDPDGPRTRAVESAYAELDRPFRRWLASLTADTDPTDAQVRWHEQTANIVREIAAGLLARSPVDAWAGREDRRGRLVTTPHADAWFRRDLRKVLPHLNAQPSPTV